MLHENTEFNTENQNQNTEFKNLLSENVSGSTIKNNPPVSAGNTIEGGIEVKSFFNSSTMIQDNSIDLQGFKAFLDDEFTLSGETYTFDVFHAIVDATDDEFTVKGKVYELPPTDSFKDLVDPIDDEFTISGSTYQLENIIDTDESQVNTKVEKIDSGLPKLFTLAPKPNSYLVDFDKMFSIDELPYEVKKERVKGSKEKTLVKDKYGKVIKFYKSINLPLVVDTEFTDGENLKDEKTVSQSSRERLTTQITGVLHDDRKIFVNPKYAKAINDARANDNLPALPITKHENLQALDYLEVQGIDVKLRPATREEIEKLPKLYLTKYGHFLVAEINTIFDGFIKDRIRELLASKGSERIVMERRLRAITESNGIQYDWVNLNAVISLNGIEYSARLRLIDSCAVHGVASYAEISKNVGFKLEYKDLLTQKDKENIFDTAIRKPKDFENYSLGDLDVYNILQANAEMFNEVYTRLGLSFYYQNPKLTIGGTDKDLFIGSLADYLDFRDKEWSKKIDSVIKRFIAPISAEELRQNVRSTSALLAKVNGGRCRNNRPTDVYVCRKVKGKYDAVLICDIDIAGCYSDGMRNQNYQIGIPELWEYKATANNNEYVTLRKWLQRYQVPIEAIVKGDLSNWGELSPGNFYTRISTIKPLKYSQDYFISWFTESKGYGVDVMAKFVKGLKSDTELIDSNQNFDEEYGSLKIFNNEIFNAPFIWDDLQWILFVASDNQRVELLDNLVVLSSAVYRKSQCLGEKVSKDEAPKLIEELISKYDNWDGKNITDIVEVGDKFGIQNTNVECHYWFSINLGDLLIDKLLIERKKAQKTMGKKSPLDILFKLCINTLYGDMVSKFFTISNPVVGNNITGRARALGWYMEKGFHGFPTITDGCPFLLNGVMYPKNVRINGEFTNQHRKGSKLANRNVAAKPLGNVKEIVRDDKGILYTVDNEGNYTNIGTGNDNPWINTQSMTHLQNLFSTVDVLHKETYAIKVEDDLELKYIPRVGQFSFETKQVYHGMGTHGSANYIFLDTVILLTGKGVTYPKNSDLVEKYIKEYIKSEFPNWSVIKEESSDNEWKHQLIESYPVEIKIRGQETKREHLSYNVDVNSEEDKPVYIKIERYGSSNNPAKDFLTQLATKPNSIKRQSPAIKKNILKVGDYKQNPEKYDSIGLEVGDNLKKVVLLQEFSLTQFTFQTYEQYMSWKKAIERRKITDKQSLESFFLNEDGTLNFVKMTENVDKMIADGVDNPIEYLDPSRNKQRATKRTVKGVSGKGRKSKNIMAYHPSLDTYQKLKDKLKQDKDVHE